MDIKDDLILNRIKYLTFKILCIMYITLEIIVSGMTKNVLSSPGACILETQSMIPILRSQKSQVEYLPISSNFSNTLRQILAVIKT